MHKYSVSVIFDASKCVDVEAESPEQAAGMAYDEAGYVGLCHQCSDEVEMGDAVRAIVCDESGEEVADDGYQEMKIAKMAQQRDELLEALEGLLADMHLRAKLDGDVDSDGCVVLNCGSSVLHAAHSAIAKANGV